MLSNSAAATLLAGLFLYLFPARLKLIYVLSASIFLFLLITGMAAKQHRREYVGLFFTQLFLLVAALVFSGRWFLSGREFTPPDYWVWTILQRGSLAAIETSAGILGIGNFLFVWIYSERDKLTLGWSQSDLIERQLGPRTYTLSVSVHFISTVLCLLLAKTGAREGAFFAFLTLIRVPLRLSALHNGRRGVGKRERRSHAGRTPATDCCHGKPHCGGACKNRCFRRYGQRLHGPRKT